MLFNPFATTACERNKWNASLKRVRYIALVSHTSIELMKRVNSKRVLCKMMAARGCV